MRDRKKFFLHWIAHFLCKFFYKTCRTVTLSVFIENAIENREYEGWLRRATSCLHHTVIWINYLSTVEWQSVREGWRTLMTLAVENWYTRSNLAKCKSNRERGLPSVPFSEWHRRIELEDRVPDSIASRSEFSKLFTCSRRSLLERIVKQNASNFVQKRSRARDIK